MIIQIFQEMVHMETNRTHCKFINLSLFQFTRQLCRDEGRQDGRKLTGEGQGETDASETEM